MRLRVGWACRCDVDRVDTELATRQASHTQSLGTPTLLCLRCGLGLHPAHTQPTVVSEEYTVWGHHHTVNSRFITVKL
jgi:hypothetical protein